MTPSQFHLPCPPAPSGFSLSARSSERLGGVHEDLAKVVRLALILSTVDFTVLEGRRSAARQKQLYQSGATRTLNSRHLSGHAVDLGAWVAGGVRWDWPLYDKIALAMQSAAVKLGVPLEWGGDWKSFRDGPHFQLPWADYPVLRQDQADILRDGPAGPPQNEEGAGDRSILRQAQSLPRRRPGMSLRQAQNEGGEHHPHPEEPPQAAPQRAPQIDGRA